MRSVQSSFSDSLLNGDLPYKRHDVLVTTCNYYQIPINRNMDDNYIENDGVKCE